MPHREHSGTARVLPVLAAAPAGDVGLHLDAFGTVGPGDKVDDYTLRAELSGAGGTVVLTLWVEDDDGNWSIPADTGNLGVLGGGAVPTDNPLVFQVNGLGAFKAACLVKSNLTGAASVDGAMLRPKFSYGEG